MVAKAMTPDRRASWNKARACWDTATSDDPAFRAWWGKLEPGDRMALMVLSCSRAFDPAIAAAFTD